MTRAGSELIDFTGPFFAVEVHDADEQPGGRWRPVSELLDGSGALTARVDAVRAALGLQSGETGAAPAWRVAASVTQLGLAARLIAPVLGAAVTTGRLLDVDPTRVWWQDELGGAFPLSIPRPAAGTTDPSRFMDAVLAPLVGAVEAAAALSPRVLWGNVASAINGAATMMARERPTSTLDAYAWAGAVMADPRLVGEPDRPGPGFRRRSCCLIYRAARADAGAASTMTRVCGDCVLQADRAG